MRSLCSYVVLLFVLVVFIKPKNLLNYCEIWKAIELMFSLDGSFVKLYKTIVIYVRQFIYFGHICDRNIVKFE